MTAKDLETLYDYGYWANKKLFQVLEQLSPEQFTQPVSGSYGSVRNTMVHMLSAEWGWLGRCGGPQRGPALAETDYPTVASLINRWNDVEGYMRDFLGKLTDDDLDRMVEFSIGDGPKQSMPLVALMRHAANHGAHHRGQVALLLKSLGVSPGNFDMFFYFGGTA